MTKETLIPAGQTSQGHYRLLAPSKSRRGAFNAVFVSKDGTRLSCDCIAANRHRLRRDGRLIVPRAHVLAGTVEGLCWHLRRAAAWSPGLRVERDADGAQLVHAPAEPFGFTVADMRRVAWVIRRAGYRGQVQNLRANGPDEPERWGRVLAYSVDGHHGEWEPDRYCEWDSVSFLRAVEALGFRTSSSAGGGAPCHVDARDPSGDAQARAYGATRTAAAAALAFAIERRTRGRRYRGDVRREGSR